MNQENNKEKEIKQFKRIPKRGGFWIVMPMIIVLAVQQLASIFVAELMMFLKIGTFTGTTYQELLKRVYDGARDPMTQLATLALYAGIIVIGFGIWYQQEILSFEKTENTWKKKLGQLKSGKTLYLVGLACLTAVLLQIAAALLSNSLGLMFPKWIAEYMSLMKSAGMDSASVTPLSVIYVIVLGPLAEELTFRGMTLGLGKRTLGFWGANVTQAMLFGLIHGNMLQGTVAFAVGIIFGMIAERTGNLVIVMFVHMLYNLASWVMPNMSFMMRSPIYFFLGLFVGLAGTYVAILMLFKVSDRVFLVEEEKSEN